jgi:hypothetical protein
VTIGAVDWRGNALKSYSSQGPTADGRQKPDFVAPTNTRVAGPNGTRAVGGTSISAPNAAGAAAAWWSAQLAGGLRPTPADIVAQLRSIALDLGTPGFDPAYGWGLLRVDADPPLILPTTPAAGAVVRGVTRAGFEASDGSRTAGWSLTLDGVPLQVNRSGDPASTRLDTRTMSEGLHALHAEARDWSGNVGAGDWTFTVDNTAPVVGLTRVRVPPPPPPIRLAAARPVRPGDPPHRRKRIKRRPPKPRPVTATVRARDDLRMPMRLQVSVRDTRGKTRWNKALALRATGGRRVALGRYLRGRYKLELVLIDRAGNRDTLRRTFVVR